MLVTTTATTTTTLFVPYIDLRDTKKSDKNIERVKATHNNHLGTKR